MTTIERRPSRKSSLANQISALGNRLTRAMSRGNSEAEDGRSISSTDDVARLVRSDSYSEKFAASESVLISHTMSDTTSTTDTRSRSRGRELYSTGRGGAGNIHRSASRGAGADDDGGSPNRGREAPVRGVDHTVHTGRGGAGNVRSPSRDAKDIVAEAAQADYEHKVVENADAKPHAVSHGRGGAGNIQTPPRAHSRESPTDQARSLSRGRVLQSTGRGGAGNITSGAGEITKLEEEEDLERANHHHDGGIHSTGRGGLANITDKVSPTHETSPPPYYPHSPAHQQEFFSSGRGGAGNIRSRSASRDVEKQQQHEHAHGHSHLHNLVEKAKHLA